MDAVTTLTIERDAVDHEGPDVAEVDSERPALADGDVTHGRTPHVVQEDHAVAAGYGRLPGGMPARIAVGFARCGRERRPDSARDRDVRVGPTVGGGRPVCEADDVRVAHHAGVAAGHEADLRLGVGDERRAGGEHERAVDVIGLRTCRNREPLRRVDPSLEGRCPDLGRHLAADHVAVLIGPTLHPRPRHHERPHVLEGIGRNTVQHREPQDENAHGDTA